MAKGFNDREKENIREKLMNAAEECWGRYGIRKTSVDQLVAMAGISKGSFYLFYESKEHLFMDVFERIDRNVKARIMTILQNAGGDKKQTFISMVRQLCREVKRAPWLLQVELGGLELLLRKLPPERIGQHIKSDNSAAAELLTLLGITTATDIDILSGAMRAIFLMLLHSKELGEEKLDDIIEFMTDAVASKLFEKG